MARSKSAIQKIEIHFPGAGRPPNRMANERDTAIKDLTRGSLFQPVSDDNGPYSIDLSIQENRLVFDIKNQQQKQLPVLVLSLSPYRRLIRDYFLMIDSYEETRLGGTRAKLEAIDMGRRGLHNEAAERMIERLKDKIEIDLETARRLFTLICVLHIGQVRQWR